MDLLLRRLSRSASDSRDDSHHLDADELSSYAENALPAAARARYTEHLAECASCRKLVAQLSSTVGIVAATETVSTPSALSKFLASLFSPMVLRYAVPALGLIVVAVIGLTVLRRNEGTTDSVAQLSDQRKAPTAPPEQTQSPSSGTIDNGELEKKEKVGSPAATPGTRSEQSKETQPAAPANAPSSVGGTADVNQAAPVTKAEQSPPAANEPPAPKPTPATDENQKKLEAEARKQETQVRAATDRENAYTPSPREARRSDSIELAPGAAAPQGAGSVAKLKRERAEEKDKNDADTRSVAGRRFRRERGVWIDTAYDSSTTTFSLIRGSEQYRALVADEPAIKTIAEQLDGEIIVVWKGRAYRIR